MRQVTRGTQSAAAFRPAGAAVLLVAVLACAPAGEPADEAAAEGRADTAGAAASTAGADADPRAREVAERTLEAMGGRQAWDETRHVRWKFFGRRLHYWDRSTGDVRIDSPAGEDRPAQLVLMNVGTREGRVWEDGEPVTDPEALRQALQLGYEWWINDSYWMFMPYKLLDPGVDLRWLREGSLDGDRPADVLELTFDEGIGVTPENRYEVWVARDTGLVEQWAFYQTVDQAEPSFTLPWTGWRTFGEIELATGHGRDRDWQIAVFDELPRSVYTDPAPVREE